MKNMRPNRLSAVPTNWQRPSSVRHNTLFKSDRPCVNGFWKGLEWEASSRFFMSQSRSGRYELDGFIDAGEGKLRSFVDGPDQVAVVCLEQTQTARLARYQSASDVANPRAVSAEPASTFNHSVLRNAELLHR